MHIYCTHAVYIYIHVYITSEGQTRFLAPASSPTAPPPPLQQRQTIKVQEINPCMTLGRREQATNATAPSPRPFLPPAPPS